MAIYNRKDEIIAVCTRDFARDYFKSYGLTYGDIVEGDIAVLVMLLDQEIKLSNKINETSTGTMTLSRKIDFIDNSNDTMAECYLYVNDRYYENRECISFNADGFIGFCGWADPGNTNPILRAFLQWCDFLSKSNLINHSNN